MNIKISDTLTVFLKSATLSAYPQLSSIDSLPLEIAPATQEKFGHYQFNSAMKLAKILGASPRAIAEAIVTQLKATPNLDKTIAHLEIAGPGFINITLNPDYLSKLVETQLKLPHLGIQLPMSAEKRRIVIDFSSPNTAKEMHVGHLRSTIIGDCLARLFEFLGHDVLRLNHIGDWGTSFGMLIAYMKEHAPAIIKGEEQTDLLHLMGFYKAAKARFDSDPDFKKVSQLEVVELQGGNEDSLKAWKIICEISRRAYQEIYDLLDIKVMERGESFYNPLLPDLVAELVEKGLVSISDGAKCIFIEGFVNRDGDPLPLMVQKADGGYNYDTTDMAAIRQRINEEKADRLIYVTDAGQSVHFQQIFKAAEMAGYLDPTIVSTDHVPFGLVLGSDGKKFRSRSGDTERLIDLLNAAVDHAEKILIERSPNLPAEERHQLAHALGIGAIKYADLCCHRTSDYTFSYDRMLRFEGNTAAYLMYSYVRVIGIKRKIGIDIESIVHQHSIHLQHPSEIALGLQLAQFYDTLEQLSIDLLPHRLTDYLYNLAEKFNAFFRDCRVEGSEQQNSRLLLSECVALTLKQGLDLLGVKVVDKM
jgi:arginyl-tRNA synthetase